MAKRRAKNQEPQRTTLWTFFGNFWKKLAEDKRAQDEIHTIERLTREQLKGKQQKVQLRLKR